MKKLIVSLCLLFSFSASAYKDFSIENRTDWTVGGHFTNIYNCNPNLGKNNNYFSIPPHSSATLSVDLGNGFANEGGAQFDWNIEGQYPAFVAFRWSKNNPAYKDFLQWNDVGGGPGIRSWPWESFTYLDMLPPSHTSTYVIAIFRNQDKIIFYRCNIGDWCPIENS